MGAVYATTALNFGITLWFARSFGLEQFGIYNFAVSLSVFALTLVNFGADVTLVRDLSQRGSPSAVLSAVWRVGAGFVAVVSLALLAGLFRYPADGNYWIVFSIVLAGAVQGLLPRGWFDFNRHFQAYSWMVLLERICFAAGAVLLVKLLGAGPWTLLLIAMLLLAVRLADVWGQYGYAKYRLGFADTSIAGEVAGVLGRNWQVAASRVANLLMTHANQLILMAQLGAAALAVYSAGFQLMMPLQIFQSELLRAFSREIAVVTATDNSDRGAAARRAMLRYCAVMIVITLLLVVPCFAFSGFLIGVVLGPKYAAALWPMRILLVWTFVLGAGQVVNQFLVCYHLTKAYVVITVLTGLLSLVLALVLVKWLGDVGAALSLLICHSLSLMIQFIIVWRHSASPDLRRTPVSPKE